MDMFTREEAFFFLKNNLKIEDAEEKVKNNRKKLLDEFVIQMHTATLFQNLCLLSVAPEKRCRPSIEQIKADLLSGVGGLCFNLNISAYFLLKALGFKALLGHAICTSSVTAPNGHVVVYVHDVEETGDEYLVEVGLGFPTYRAVNLDFDTESPAFVDSFLEYKYIKLDGQLLRMHRKDDLMKKFPASSPDSDNFVVDGWRRFYFANLMGTNNVEDVYPSFQEIFTNPEASSFHRSFSIIGFPGKKAVIVINNTTLMENDTGKLEANEIEGGDEGIIHAVLTHFPVFPEYTVRNAVKYWRQLDC